MEPNVALENNKTTGNNAVRGSQVTQIPQVVHNNEDIGWHKHTCTQRDQHSVIMGAWRIS